MHYRLTTIVVTAILLLSLVCGSLSAKPLLPDSIDALIERLQDPHWLTANHAMQDLIKHGKAAVDRLIPLLQHSDPTVRYRTVEVLGCLGQDAVNAVKALQELQWDAALHVSSAASRVLANLDRTYPSIGAMQALANRDYPWLMGRSVESILLTAALHHPNKLIGFGSHAYAVDYSSDYTAFFLLHKQSEGYFILLDLTTEIDPFRVYHRTRNLTLPGREYPSILLAADHYAKEILPAHYVLDERGVILFVTGEWLFWSDETSPVSVTAVTESAPERGSVVLPWAEKNVLPSPWSPSWTVEDQLRAAPYERQQWIYHPESGRFLLELAVPLTFYAAAASWITSLESSYPNANDWQERYLTRDLMNLLREETDDPAWEAVELLARNPAQFLGYSQDDAVWLEAAGQIIELRFDRPYQQAYLSLRVPWPDGKPSDPGVSQPRIDRIYHLGDLDNSEN